SEIREGVKSFSNWPTIPQVYVNGKFIGGCDIVRDLYSRGELEALVKSAVAAEG
ncbi:MAG: glutaredoxin domain-containing protein, partial [Candidatus Binatia bacterium]